MPDPLTDTDVPGILKKIKELEATVQERDNQLLQHQRELSKASQHKRLYGLNDVKTMGTRLAAMRDPHAKFCAKYTDGKTTPKTLQTRTELLEFTEHMIAEFEARFADHLEAIKTEPPPKKKKST